MVLFVYILLQKVSSMRGEKSFYPVQQVVYPIPRAVPGLELYSRSM